MVFVYYNVNNIKHKKCLINDNLFLNQRLILIFTITCNYFLEVHVHKLKNIQHLFLSPHKLWVYWMKIGCQLPVEHINTLGISRSEGAKLVHEVNLGYPFKKIGKFIFIWKGSDFSCSQIVCHLSEKVSITLNSRKK